MGRSHFPKQMCCFQYLETLAAVSQLNLENSVSGVVWKPWKMLSPKLRGLTQDRSPTHTPGKASLKINCLQKSSWGHIWDHKQKVIGLGIFFSHPSLISNVLGKTGQLSL